MMRLLTLLLLLLSMLLPANGSAQALGLSWLAQADPPPFEIKDLQVQYQFGVQASFEAWLSPADQVQEIHLMIQPAGKNTQVETIPPASDGHLLFQYDLSSAVISPFSPVEYWLRVTLTSGEQVESPHQSFLYEDNRFEWQVLEKQDDTLKESYIIKWYAGDLSFGQAVLDVTLYGMVRARELVNAQPPQPLRVYVYPTAADLQDALALIDASWVAGHASPEYGTLLVSLAPGSDQRLEMERQLPHEITHILLYQAYGDRFNRLPQWLNEGLASLSELYPNAEYKRALQKAAQSNALLPMESLCNSFPREASGAFLAYAQAESFTRFLSQKFGNATLHELSGLYADGVDCLQGIQTVYDTSLEQLEQRWKQEYLGIDASQLAWQSLLPYLVLMLLVLLPAIASGIWFRRKQ